MLQYDLDEFMQLVEQNAAIFSLEELAMVQTSLVAMQNDIQLEYQDAIDASHNGQPMLVQTVITGGCSVSQSTVQTALLRKGIATSQSSPFPNILPLDPPVPLVLVVEDNIDDLLNPNGDILLDLPAELWAPPITVVLYTGPLSDLPDSQLDTLILQLHSHFWWAGISMLDGILQRLGHRVPRQRVRESLLQIDPVQ
ncbi:hypothetical protein C8J57DRAFT_1248028 [Mycena rebaudengoi]|nr:hypothetical protein C8J57DRAFT_1248028 [Mycena rebaudengoi]